MMQWFVIAMLILAIITALGRLKANPEQHTAKGILGAFILYLMVFCIGGNNLWNFLGNFLYSDQVAEYAGWSSGSPYQLEVAAANLALGVLGILCIWEGSDFWLATALGGSIFQFGSGLCHLWQVAYKNNVAPGNTGFILYFDLLFPIVLLIMMMIYRRITHHHAAS